MKKCPCFGVTVLIYVNKGLGNIWGLYAWLLRGAFVSWWYLPRIYPSVIDMQHYYHARYPTDWDLAYMFPVVYFSVEVCLEGVFPHSAFFLLAHVEIPAPGSAHPSRENKIEQWVTRLSTWGGVKGGIWTDTWVCLHYWMLICVVVYFNFPLYCKLYVLWHKQDTI